MSKDDTAHSRDPEQTKKDILAVALDEFATHGFTGARVDRIARDTRTTKGMLYYYFGDKEGLYRAILEQVYPTIRSQEELVDTTTGSPLDAMNALLDFTFDYHETHQAFVRLVMIENIHNAAFLRDSGIDSSVSFTILKQLADVVDRGVDTGVFCRRVSPLDLHVLFTSFCFYRISNQHTVQTVLGLNMLSPQSSKRHRDMLKAMVLAYLQSAD